MTDNLLWFRNLILFITPITKQSIVKRESRIKVIHTIYKNLHVALDYTCYMISFKRLIYLSLFYILKFTLWKDATEKKFLFISRSWEPIKWPVLPFSRVRETLCLIMIDLNILPLKSVGLVFKHVLICIRNLTCSLCSCSIILWYYLLVHIF